MTDQQPPATGNTSPEQRIARVFDANQLNTLSLVLSAANITHHIRIVTRRHMEIYVAEALAERAHHEIATYTAENKNWPHHFDSTPAFQPVFRAMSPLIIGCITAIYGMTGEWRPEAIWFLKGAGNSKAILEDSEFFRLATALTLHADVVHLLSNGIFGGFLLHYFLQLTGNGIGLCAMLFTAVLANYLNVLMHGPGHAFVGFSTAVFSIIGMLCTMRFAFKTSHLVIHIFMPIMAGLALLAMLGAEGERTDLGSHLLGLLCGLVVGNFARLPIFHSLRTSFWLQTSLACIFFIAVYWCWLLAFSR